MDNVKVFAMPLDKVYPLLVNKAVRNGRTEAEVRQLILWLTGYEPDALDALLASSIAYGDFFLGAPRLNPNRSLITGRVCGVRVETIEDPLMREIRYLDKLVDELAGGKSMAKILRGAE